MPTLPPTASSPTEGCQISIPYMNTRDIWSVATVSLDMGQTKSLLGET